MIARNGKFAERAERVVRCAIYTRKSTEEGLDQDFNSLDAQREAGEAFIKSQRSEGWTCLPDRFDDGGFTGANMDRPALRRLLAAIEADKVDCIVVYKVDRLSRSLLDFAKIMEIFDRHNVSFVSVTQAFNTASSMGRLMMNVLLSFAQFERETISERTRDKMAATRRKGKHVGGAPILGYDLVEKKLVVNAAEVELARMIFRVYLELDGLISLVKELQGRGWRNKKWMTRKGVERGGRAFTKTSVYHMLRNVTYIGKVKYENEIYEGEHDAIIDDDLWQKVQAKLKRNGGAGGVAVRNRDGALLKGLLYCASCECGMSHSYSSKGNRRYRYYVCQRAQKQGWQSCPSPSVPAGEIERFIVEQIKSIGNDDALVAATLAELGKQVDSQRTELKQERAALARQIQGDESGLGRLNASNTNSNLARQADLQDHIATASHRISDIDVELARLDDVIVDRTAVAAALADFDAVWAALRPREQFDVLQQFIERIDFDGAQGSVAIRFRPTGISALADLQNQEATTP